MVTSRLAERGAWTGVGAHASPPSAVVRKSRLPKSVHALGVQLTPWLAICGLSVDIETHKRPLPSAPIVGV
jgi:hypothetical protein